MTLVWIQPSAILGLKKIYLVLMVENKEKEARNGRIWTRIVGVEGKLTDHYAPRIGTILSFLMVI